MQYRKNMNRMLGIAALAMLFGGTSVHAQSGSSSAAEQGATSSTQQQGSTGASTSAGTSASGGQQAGSKMMSKSDQNLMRELAYSNLGEIEAGKIALSQSKNEQVRSFAQKMIDDHTQAQKELEQLAQAKGVTLPTEPDRKHKAAAKELSALEADKFDKRYLAQGGLRDHRNTHRLLERAQNRASDPDLKALAAKMTPIVNQHLEMAQEVSSARSSTSGSMGPAGTSSSSSTSGSSTSADKPAASGTSGSSNSTSPGKQ